MPKRYTPRRKAPYRKAGKRYYRKNRSAVSKPIRKKGYSRPSTVIIKQPSGVPDRLFVKLKYREALTWSQTLGALSANVYLGNSCYDPDVTGGGGQPYFFDQWSALYTSYRIHGSKVRAQFACNGGGGFNGLMIGITPSPSGTSFGSSGQELIEEQPYTKKIMLKMGAAAVGQGELTHYISTRKILGLSKKAEEDLDLSALTSASPAKTWYWHVWCYSTDQNTVAAESYVTLTYYVEFFARNRPGLS